MASDGAFDYAFPFEAIHDAIAAGKVIPFLGAGASMELRQPDEQWSLDLNSRFGPLGAELAQWLGKKSTLPGADQATDLARVAQFADSKIGREGLRLQLDRVFKSQRSPSGLHEYLASFEQPLIIMTTNYDDMIEAAFEQAGRPFHLVVETISPDRATTMRLRRARSEEIEEVNEVSIDIDSTAVIFKIHGSCGPGDISDYVITEDDYLRFLQRMVKKSAIPTVLAEPMRTRQFLFVGYGLEDWNFRLLFHQLKEFIAKPQTIKRPSWAIMHEVDEVDRRLWMERSVELLEIPLPHFVAGMVAARDGSLGE